MNLPSSKGRQFTADLQPADDLTATAPEPSLVALAMSGDDEAFEELVRRRQGAVRGLMHRLSGDRRAADDYAQEAFLRAWRKLSTLRSPDAFGGWLRRIAVNVFLQHVRRTGQDVPGSDETETLPAVERRDHTTRIDLQNALARLKPVERLCVVLAYDQRMSHSEIVSATGLPLGTVKSHISRGSERLRRYLSDYEDDVR